MKHIFFAVFLMLFPAIVDAQQTCFNSKTMMAERDAISGPDFMDSAMTLSKRQIEALKGCAFPGKDLFLLGGGKININMLKGNLVFVNFWFSSCHPCVEEFPDVIKLSEKYKKKIRFLSVSFDEKRTTLSFLADKPHSDVIYAYADEGTLLNSFCAIFGYPMCLLLDKDAKVIAAWSGGMPDFYETVDTLLKAHL
jgi:thiol-disulfide isomerase/thioredoxin